MPALWYSKENTRPVIPERKRRIRGVKKTGKKYLRVKLITTEKTHEE
jgi:hypothetical protein